MMKSFNTTALSAFLKENTTAVPSSPSIDVIDEWLSTQTNPPYMVAMYLSMGIFGILGNIVTCIVIVTNRSMHTVTNCYLFNLAISDLIMLFFSYPPLDGYAKYNSKFICVLRVLLAECSVYVSVLTISAFSVERYLAICHPFRARALSRLSRIPIVIPVLWLLGILCALPMSLQLGLTHHATLANYAVCDLSTDFSPRSFELSTAVFFVLPMLLIAWMYGMIGLTLSESGRMKGRMAGEDETVEEGDVRLDRSMKRALRMLVTVVAAFFICWAPFHVQRLMSIHSEEIFGKRMDTVDGIIYHISAVLSYSSTVINPILYNIMSNKFRRAFKDTLVRSCEIFKINKLTD